MTQQQYPVHREVRAGDVGKSGGAGGRTSSELLGVGATVSHLILRNESGAAVPKGTAVKVALGGSRLAFTTSTIQGDERTSGITLDAISNNVRGRVALGGHVRQARVASGSTRGQWLRQSTTAGVLEGVDNPTHGCFAIQVSDRDSTTGLAEVYLHRHETNVTLIVRKEATETVNNSATLQDDNELFFAVEANEVWAFRAVLFFISSAAADIKFAWTIPASATIRWSATNIVNAINTASTVYDDSNFVSTDGTSAQLMVVLDGIVVVSSTAGDVTLQWAQIAAAVSDTQVLVNSYLIAHKQA